MRNRVVFGFLIGAFVALVFVMLVTWLGKQERDYITPPPPGYEFCANDHTIGYCRKEV
jgi:hypothetical protein